MDNVVFDERTLDRMVRAVEKVRERLVRATAALEKANIPYAVIGGNAVASWVAQVDEAAVRNTQDVDILLRRGDLEAATAALAPAGFIHRHVKSIDMFLDGPDSKARDAVHVIFAAEKVRPDDLAAHCIKDVLRKTPQLNPAEIEDVFLGCAVPEGSQGDNVARVAAIRAGLRVAHRSIRLARRGTRR